MSNPVMISIHPKWCKKILSGEKTIEVRKNCPKLETPFKAYIYCTKGRPDLNIPISQERLMQDCERFIQYEAERLARKAQEKPITAGRKAMIRAGWLHSKRGRRHIR